MYSANPNDELRFRAQGYTQVPDENQDELAIRLRSEGLTFREIGARLGVSTSMAHRRVKRALLRRRCDAEERMEDIRKPVLDHKINERDSAEVCESSEQQREQARRQLRAMMLHIMNKTLSDRRTTCEAARRGVEHSVGSRSQNKDLETSRNVDNSMTKE